MNEPPALEDKDRVGHVEQLLVSGRIERARSVISNFLEEQRWRPASLDELNRIGRVLVEFEEVQDLLASLENQIHHHPQPGDLRKNVARLLVRKAINGPSNHLDLLRRAEVHIRHFLIDFPSDARAHALAGVIFERQGQVNEAVEAWRCAHVLNPVEPDYRVGIAVALCAVGRYREAISHFEWVAKQRPRRADVHVNLGLALRESGALDRALAAFRTAALLQPKSARIMVDIGLCLRGQGKLDEAVQAFQEAILLNPDRADSYHQFGRVLIRGGYFDEAKSVLGRASELEPRNPNIQRTLQELSFAWSEQNEGVSNKEEADTLAMSAMSVPDLQANLVKFAVPDIVEFLGLGRCTGVLVVTTPHAHGELELIEGRLLSGWILGLPPLAERLQNLGIEVPLPFLDQAVDRGVGLLLEALLADGFEDRESAVKDRLFESCVEALLVFVETSEGEIHFRSRLAGRGQDSRLMAFSSVTQAVLLEVYRRYDEQVAKVASASSVVGEDKPSSE
ncbi:MAG: tetratricopeptide repeat protein [Myxococcales bacterium]|nr:tetratricopeptide repeat protein [Myxococcales bacterium]